MRTVLIETDTNDNPIARLLTDNKIAYSFSIFSIRDLEMLCACWIREGRVSNYSINPWTEPDPRD